MTLAALRTSRAFHQAASIPRHLSSSRSRSCTSSSRNFSSSSRASSSLLRLPSTSTSSPSLRSRPPHRISLSQTRAFSLWPSGSSPAPIIGNDGKLQDKSATSSATTVNTPTTSEGTLPGSASTSGNLDSVSPIASTPSPSGQYHLETLPTELSESIEQTRRVLSDYGLGGGGFVGRTQDLLEWTHLTTGLPWYATIGAVVITIRLMLLPIMVKGIANNARMAHIQPRLMANIAKIKKANQEGNQLDAQRLQLETKAMFKDNNCGPLRGLIPPLFQMPLFICFFLALRGMADAGLPDFATGGLSWFTNLSAPDPYYVLPVLSSAATLAVLQVGEYGMPEKQGMAKGIMSAIKLATPVIIWFTSTFPAAVLVYWVTHNSFSILQTLLLRLPAFKRLANIPDPPPRDPSKPVDVIGFRQAFRDTADAFSETMEGAKERTAKKMEEKELARVEKEKKTEFEDRKKAAVARMKAEAPTLDQAVNSQIVTEGDETVATFVPRQATAADAAEEAKRKRVADARKRREQSKTKRSRL